MQQLNPHQRISRYSSKNIDISTLLPEHIATIYEKFYRPETQLFDYSGFAQSEEFQTYQLMLSGLHHLNITHLRTSQEKTSFWLNIYNMLCIHIVIKLGVTRSIEEQNGFFSQYGYFIGGREFSLDDMEHGILRANNKGYSKFQRPFKNDDFTLALACKAIDPKIHFGLYCASVSSPRLVLFKADALEQQLKKNTAQCIEKHMHFDFDKGIIQLPKIFKWYESDFGGKIKAIEFIAEHASDQHIQSNLLTFKEKLKIEFLVFDWTINQA